MDDPIKRKRILYIGVAVFFVLFLILIVSSKGNSNLDVLPTESSSVDYSNRVVFTNGKKLLTAMGSTKRYELLAKDLYKYGQKSYKDYAKSKVVMGFEVKSDIKNQGDVYSFDGRFGKSKNKIIVQFKVLANERINTSITDSKTKVNIDKSLPSNNKRNTFIATLPVEHDGYSISFDSSSDSFIINLYDGSSAELDKAATYLISQIGEKDLSGEKVNFIRSNDITSQNTVVPTSSQQDDTE